jgi:hypothetical protein
LSFIRENWWRLENEELDDWMLGGFEIIFPRLLEMAVDLGLDVHCDEYALRDVFAKRDQKLARCTNIYTVDYTDKVYISETIRFSRNNALIVNFQKLTNL